MVLRTLFTLLLALSWLHLETRAKADDAAKLPNVIVVMADDLGIGDLSATNPECKIKTPHLQQMADEGLTFFTGTRIGEVETLAAAIWWPTLLMCGSSFPS